MEGNTISGYAVLYHKGTSLARLYSIAVSPTARSKETLPKHWSRRWATRPNAAVFSCDDWKSKSTTITIKLYESLGYKSSVCILTITKNHRDALRFFKTDQVFQISANTLEVPLRSTDDRVHLWPASLMMAVQR